MVSLFYNKDKIEIIHIVEEWSKKFQSKKRKNLHPNKSQMTFFKEKNKISIVIKPGLTG